MKESARAIQELGHAAAGSSDSKEVEGIAIHHLEEGDDELSLGNSLQGNVFQSGRSGFSTKNCSQPEDSPINH